MKQFSRRIDGGILLLFVFLVASWFFARYYTIDADALLEAFGHLPPAISAACFVFLYVALTFLIFFSKDILWLAGAILFGPLISSLCVYAAECINACLLWYCARFLGGKFVPGGQSRKIDWVASRIKGTTFAWLLVLRATPLVPYRFMDLAAGACGISLTRYMAAVVLGSWLKIFWVQYMLSAVGKAALTDCGAVARYYLEHPALLWVSLAYLALVGIVALTFKRK